MSGDVTAARELVAAVLIFLDCDTAWGAADQRTLAAKTRPREQLDVCIDHGNAVDLGDAPMLTVLHGGIQ